MDGNFKNLMKIIGATLEARNEFKYMNMASAVLATMEEEGIEHDSNLLLNLVQSKVDNDLAYSFIFKPYTVKKLEKAIRLLLENKN